MDATTNGHTSNGLPPREKLRDLRLKRRIMEEELSLSAVERTRKLWESHDSGSLWLNAYSERLSKYESDPSWHAFTSTHDRRFGRNIPLFQTETELNLLRMQARIAAGSNTYAIGMVEGLTSYVIGPGFVYKAASKKRAALAAPELLEAIQDIIDDFKERNQWDGGEQPAVEDELFQRSVVDGEFLVRHFAVEDGRTEIRTVEPEQLTQPSGSNEREWSFGVNVDPQDVQKFLAFWVAYLGEGASEGEEVSPEDMTFFRRNAVRSVKRGMPDLSWGTLDALHIAAKLMGHMGTGAALQSSIGYIREHANASQQQVSDFTGGLANWQLTSPITGASENVQHHGAGRIIDVPASLKYVAPPAYTGTQTFVDILTACLRGAGRRWQCPDWLIAGDASNNNYASSLVAESPFVRTVERAQKGYKHAFLRIMWKAVENYVKHHGELVVPVKDPSTGMTSETRYDLKDIKRLVEIQAEAPSVQTRDKSQEAQVNNTYLQAKIKSVQTIQQELGLDSEREAANTKEWDKEMGGQDGQGQPGQEQPAEEEAPLDEAPPEEGAPSQGDEGGEGDLSPEEMAALGLGGEEQPAEGEETAPTDETGMELGGEEEAPPEDEVGPEGDQSEAAASNDLKANVGGSQAIAGLQKAFYAGELPRDAAIANASIVFGFTDDEAARLFPDVAPQRLTPEDAEETGARNPALESLDREMLEAGFSGEKKDKRGHRLCYVNGKRVPCAPREKPRGEGRKKAADQDEAASKAKAAWDEGDKEALGRIAAQIKAEGSKRGGLGVAGLKSVAVSLGIKGHGKLKKAGLVQAIQDRLQGGNVDAEWKGLASRLDRIELAEAGTGISFKDRIINGVLAKRNDAKTAAAIHHVMRNGDKSKDEVRVYLRTVRENALKDLQDGKIAPDTMSLILGSLSESGVGTIKPEEVGDYLGGTLRSKAKPGAVAPGPGNILPDEIGLEPAPRQRKKKQDAAPAKPADYMDRMQKPLADRVAHIHEMEKAGGESFVSQALRGIIGHPDINDPNQNVHKAAVDRIMNAGPGKASAADKAAVSASMEGILGRIQRDEISQEHIGEVLEKIDQGGQGTMGADEFVALAKKTEAMHKDRLLDPSKWKTKPAAAKAARKKRGS